MKFLFLCVNDSDVIGIFEYGCESVRRPGAALSARDGRDGQHGTFGLVFSETDIAVPGRGLGIEFTRCYNSDGVNRQTYGASYIGHEWSHSYQWSLNSATIITGSGSQQRFTQTGSGTSIKFHLKAGVRATLKLVQSGDTSAYIYTTREGIRYKFEELIDSYGAQNVLKEISDPNGNRVQFHYENAPEYENHPESNVYGPKSPRLVAVEDQLGRLLKFYYGVRIDNVDSPRYISKVEFGLGTSTALTTVHQTVKYSYSRYRRSVGSDLTFLTSVTHLLGTGDPRGTEVMTQYEYNLTDNHYVRAYFGYLTAIVLPPGTTNRIWIFVYGEGEKRGCRRCA